MAFDPQGELYGEELLAGIAALAWKDVLATAAPSARITADIERGSGGMPHRDQLTMVMVAVRR
jgi:hypothetical protein